MHRLPRALAGRLGAWRSQVRAWAYRQPAWLGRQVVREFWDQQAASIHARWGDERHDVERIGEVIERLGARRILDVGCGSGRLFPLYQAKGARVLGIDLSAEALALAAERYPDVELRRLSVEALDDPVGSFDLAVCNRVLQHVPAHAITAAIRGLCRVSTAAYVNELSDSDAVDEEFYMLRHDYVQLFAAQGWTEMDEGRIGRQTWRLFTSAGSA